MGQIANFIRQELTLPLRLIKDVPFTVIGLGGIGSPVGITIGKMGAGKMMLWDGDRIVRHNLPNQLYRLDQLEQFKAEALARNIRDFAQVKIEPVTRMYSGESLQGIVVSGVHDLPTRKLIWEGVKSTSGVEMYVECRMAAELFQIFPVVMKSEESREWYQRRLYIGKKVHAGTCTTQTLFYNVMACAGYVGQAVKNYLVGDVLPHGITVYLNRFKTVLE